MNYCDELFLPFEPNPLSLCVFGNLIKCGHELNVMIMSTLIKGVFHEGEILMVSQNGLRVLALLCFDRIFSFISSKRRTRSEKQKLQINSFK